MLAQKLVEVKASASPGGGMPELSGHLWLGASDAAAIATSLAPKLRKSQAEVSKLLAEAVSLEVCAQSLSRRIHRLRPFHVSRCALLDLLSGLLRPDKGCLQKPGNCLSTL